jgi:hypothetical protein
VTIPRSSPTSCHGVPGPPGDRPGGDGSDGSQSGDAGDRVPQAGRAGEATDIERSQQEAQVSGCRYGGGGPAAHPRPHSGLDWAGVPVAVLARNDRTEAGHALAHLPSGTDAVLAMSDELALAVLRTATRTVPGQLAVTGWDDTAAAAEAGLTTVAQSLQDQGRRCARLVAGDPPGPAPSWSVIVRSSTR